MGILRQMSELYLRGSVANVTMASLTHDQKRYADDITRSIVDNPDLVRHKAKFLKELSVTIKGDYADDRKAAEQEYYIAVWRGVVALLYHHDYSFHCGGCQTTTSTTQRGNKKPLDRMEVPCPNCRCAEVVDPGTSGLNQGQIINHDEIQEQYKVVPFGSKSPTFKSIIKPNRGKKKYDNPEVILNCPIQLKKFFGEYIWNYFRQHIKENKRKQHNKKPVMASGPADQMTVEAILSLCTQLKVAVNRQHKILPENGFYSIRLMGLLTPPEFSIELALITQVANNSGVRVVVSPQSIDVQVVHDAPFISVTVIQTEHVTMLDSTPTNDDSEVGSFSVEQVSYRTVGALKMDHNDHVATIDMTEAASRTRDSLPLGNCRHVYDIYSQIGDSYYFFSEKYGDSMPKVNHIAEFLKITTRAVKQHKETIRINCLRHNYMPELNY